MVVVLICGRAALEASLQAWSAPGHGVLLSGGWMQTKDGGSVLERARLAPLAQSVAPIARVPGSGLTGWMAAWPRIGAALRPHPGRRLSNADQTIGEDGCLTCVLELVRRIACRGHFLMPLPLA